MDFNRKCYCIRDSYWYRISQPMTKFFVGETYLFKTENSPYGMNYILKNNNEDIGFNESMFNKNFEILD